MWLLLLLLLQAWWVTDAARPDLVQPGVIGVVFGLLSV
jgi:hypothetical protein